ncbi:MAG: hypothetical protein GY863_04805 [bacterium]|nr:hypothetical protein [bacterium]
MSKRTLLILLSVIMLLSCKEQPQILTGEDVIRAMYAKYEGKWFRNMSLKQNIIRYNRDGTVRSDGIMTEQLRLPGIVRGNTLPMEDGNAEIFKDNTYHIFQNGKLVNKQRYIHGVLILGFDVYLQEPEKTIALLEEDGVDFSKMHETVWQDKPVYVVGTDSSDLSVNQFWIEKERLVVVRLFKKSVRNAAMVNEIQFNKLEPLGEGWVAGELIFKLNGKMYIHETYVEFKIEDGFPDKIFDVENFIADF